MMGICLVARSGRQNETTVSSRPGLKDTTLEETPVQVLHRTTNTTRSPVHHLGYHHRRFEKRHKARGTMHKDLFQPTEWFAKTAKQASDAVPPAGSGVWTHTAVILPRQIYSDRVGSIQRLPRRVECRSDHSRG